MILCSLGGLIAFASGIIIYLVKTEAKSTNNRIDDSKEATNKRLDEAEEERADIKNSINKQSEEISDLLGRLARVEDRTGTPVESSREKTK